MSASDLSSSCWTFGVHPDVFGHIAGARGVANVLLEMQSHRRAPINGLGGASASLPRRRLFPAAPWESDRCVCVYMCILLLLRVGSTPARCASQDRVHRLTLCCQPLGLPTLQQPTRTGQDLLHAANAAASSWISRMVASQQPKPRRMACQCNWGYDWFRGGRQLEGASCTALLIRQCGGRKPAAAAKGCHH